MAYEATSGSNSQGAGADSYPKYAECTKGDTLAEGVLTRVITDRYGKPGWIIKGADGKTIGLNHSKKMEEAMQGVNIGDQVKAIYAGSFTLTTGPFKGTDMHLFDVLVDRDVPTARVDVQPEAAPFDPPPAPSEPATNAAPETPAGTSVAPGLAAAGSPDDILAKYRQQLEG